MSRRVRRVTRHGDDARAVQVLACDTVYQGYFRVDRWRLSHALHAGGMSVLLTREVFERGHVAAVQPYDPLRDEVVLIEQFRPGALAAGWEPWLIECVAGVIEPGESAQEMARREAREEAGLELLDVVPVMRFLASPGACSESVELFCARVDTRDVHGVHGLIEEGEDIRVLVVSLDEALAMLQGGRIVNATTIIGLQWLAANRARLAQRWDAPRA